MKKTQYVLMALTMTLGLAVQAQEAKAGDAVAGQKKAAMCIGCHGIPGYRASFPEVYQVPMISGQGDKYIVSALTAYRKGDRKHPTMRSIAGSLTDGDIADLAAYYAAGGTQGSTSAAAGEPGADVAALLTKGNCVACHGANLSKPIDPTYPKLAGQHPDYLLAALKAYKTEGNANVGRANAIMGAQAKPYSNAELKLLAKYISTLPSDLQVVSNSKIKAH
ncbi:MAG: cytochrome c [Leptothrix sp. (in: b-proteobacteria)]